MFDLYSYLAGLIDGDGSISIVKHTDSPHSRVGYSYYCLAVQLSQLDTPEFRALVAELGCRLIVVSLKTTAGRSVAKTHWWGKKADALLENIGPLLKLKARQWLLVQTFWSVRDKASEEELESLRAQMIAVNKET